MSNILMIVTGANTLTLNDGTEHPTGFWAEELVTAHRDLVAAGHTVTIATPGGVTPTVDAGSLDPSQAGGDAKARRARRLPRRDRSRPRGGRCRSPTVDAADYAAIVLPGGHGPMTDLAFDANVGRVLVAANDAGTIIAPFCHGPAALLSATLADGIVRLRGPPPHRLHRRGGAHGRHRREDARGGSSRACASAEPSSTRPHRGAITSSSTATSSPARTPSRARRSRAG